MAHKSTPELQVICSPTTAIPQRSGNFLVVDRFGELTFQGMGDAQALLPDDVSGLDVTSFFAQQPQFTHLAGVEQVRFSAGGLCEFGPGKQGDSGGGSGGGAAGSTAAGGGSDIAGFILLSREAMLDSKIGDNGGTLDTPFTNLLWEEVSGTWLTFKPPVAPRQCCIMNAGSDTTAKARTVGVIPRNRSFGFTWKFTNLNPDGPLPGSRVQWGGDGDGAWSIVARHGMKFQVEKKAGGAWKVMQVFNGGPTANLDGGYYRIKIRRIAGRLVVSIGPAHGTEMHFWLMDVSLPATQTGQPASSNNEDVPKGKDVVWPEGQIYLNAFNTRARLGLFVIKYSEADGALHQGTISRSVARKVHIDDDALPQVFTTGWKRSGIGLAVNPTLAPYRLDYDISLKANADGIDTPLIGTVILRYQPVFSTPATATLDIASAVSSVVVKKANPPFSCGDEVTLQVDRETLEKLSDEWKTYLNRRTPLTIKVRWRYDDGTHGAWTTLFDGYAIGFGAGTQEVDDRHMSVTGRDLLVRLQRPAAILDATVPPLDVWFAIKGLIAQSNGQAEPDLSLYGYECVQEMIRLVLGDGIANAMNGNGNPGRFFAPSHYPILNSRDDSCGYFELQQITAAANYNTPPPTRGSFYFPVPFTEDLWYWIMQIAEMEKATCFIGWPSDDTSPAPCVIYGRPEEIIKNRSSRRVVDTVYAAGDFNRLMNSVEVETKPEREINQVWALAQPLKGGLEAFAPSIRSYVAALPSSDPNSAAKTWPTTLVIREDLNALPGAAEAVAKGTLSLITGVDFEWPVIDYAGDEGCQWGDVLVIEMSGAYSDTSLGLNGKKFCAEGITHVIVRNQDELTFRTVANVRPLNASEAASLA